MDRTDDLAEIDAFLDDVFAESAVVAADEPVAWMPNDPVGWIEREFFIPETKGPLQLQPYHRAVLREALRCDENGDFVYSLVLWSDLKKSVKSTIAGAVTLFLAWHHEWETARVIGNDLRQANSRSFFYIERAIKLNPRLKSRCVTKNYKISLPNNTTIEAIPVDPDGEAGGGDLIVCFTELWAAKNEAAKRLWTETTLSPLKYGRSLRWCETYAGFDGESPILEQLYEQGVTNGRPLDVGIPGLELTTNDGARMLCLWNTKPRCPWQTPEYYQQEAGQLAPSEFDRIHGNKWQSATEAFVPIEWWDACKAALPPLRRNQEIVLSADAGVSSDNFALVGVTRDGEMTDVRYVRIWKPPPNGKIIFGDPDDPENTDYAEGEILRLCRQYNVVRFVGDPWQLHDLMTRIRRRNIVAVEEFSQGNDRLIADKHLYDIIRERRIRWDDTIPRIDELRQHIANANQKTEGDKLRIVKRDAKLKIDAAVDLSMAAYTAKRLNLG